MIKPIVQDGHPTLREMAQEISPDDISSKEVQQIIQDMHDSLATQKDGVALAAPQIAINKKIFVVASFIFEKPQERNLVYINPEIIHQSKKTKIMKDEGCLSCRWKIGDVERHLETTIRAYDAEGNFFEETADGLLAHIFQHEIDHLNATLFIDKATNLREMTEKEINERTK